VASQRRNKKENVGGPAGAEELPVGKASQRRNKKETVGGSAVALEKIADEKQKQRKEVVCETKI
jgi:hypothetical protein